MSMNLSNIKWGWVVLGTVIALVIAFASSICVVTVYATSLAFQARGAPDQAMINGFAAQYAGAVTSVFIGLGTLVGGLLAGRKAKQDAFQNGLMVGLITALSYLLLDIIGGLSLWSIVGFILAAGGGWLGGRLAGRRAGKALD